MGYDVYLKAHQNDQSSSALGLTTLQTMTLASAGALAIDWSLGNTCVVTMQANASSVTFANPIAGQFYSLTLVQDATGSRTWTSGPSSVRWMNTTYLGGTAGSIPTLTTTASKRDSLLFYFDGTNYWQVGQVFNQS